MQWIVRNPWSGLSIDKTKGSPREPWDADDLPRLFDSELFTAYTIPKQSKACLDACYWAPLIAAFTGARVSEIAQLRLADVVERASVHCFAFRDEGEGQRIKTDAARREVPIHSELVRLGFLDYVNAIANTGASRVFPAIPLADHANGAGGYLSNWFSDYKQARGFGPSKVFHSFRHTVRTTLTEAGIAEPVIDRLCGHESKGSEGAKTYTRLSVAALVRAVEAIRYPGFAPARVFKAPVWSPGTRLGRRTV